MSSFRFFVISFFGLSLIVLISRHAIGAEVCMASADMVRASYPAAWPSWHGHRYAKCWFPAQRRGSHVRYEVSVQAIPLPRPVIKTIDWGAVAQSEAQVRLFAETMTAGLDAFWLRYR